MTKTIPLTRGCYATVDDEDYELLSSVRWHVSSSGYAVRSDHDPVTGKRLYTQMHRVILGAQPGETSDHINRDRLDNRRCNLRIVSRKESTLNRKIKKGKTSQYSGVSWNKNRRKWQVNIGNDGHQRYLGLFENELDAARVYDLAAQEAFGEFAVLNF